MKVETRWYTAEDYNALRGTSFLTKVRFFWRKGWTEIPVVMGASILATIGFSLAGFALYYGKRHDLTPKYRQEYVIYRPDDPRVKKIKTTSLLD
ncbi:hypothetical protein DMN91_010679 [Ooceraea biroi]|uniref:Uncharacterized protein n=1 Tax=Ooceraea biroi TaxID=2015173 RepID=A0A026WSI9_OOCBI|nr:uncharacterized protein LOC105275838 [Ooceraea biroi]EZA58948.1 hypothetical protein X777_16907 [Ooceraea biroi]RLU16611.1 hypothetical protein DMN91_010679 [Ooceraea biroi]